MKKTEDQRLKEAYESGSYSSIKGLRKKERRLLSFLNRFPDNEKAQDYLDEIQEIIFEKKLNRY
jgi:hypothetical protein